MARIYPDWISAFLDYADVVESPRMMHYWSAVSAIAGALRKKVWIDMKRFRWSPNFFIIFVAKPGIVAKSTTAGIAMDLLRDVPGINFGPDVVTWPALVSAIAEAGESFSYNDEWVPMSPLTFVASELGNLINMQDRDAINLYIDLWDGRKSLSKVTKGSGSDKVDSPWINIIGCTTLDWVAQNMTTSTIAGGFTSRCVFVYAEKKAKFVAYVDEHVSEVDEEQRKSLIHDLEHISQNLCGPFTIAKDAREWGQKWYEEFWTNRPEELFDVRLDGYVARRQTHLHKLAMIMSASRGDSLEITADDLMISHEMLKSTEKDLIKVFSTVGLSEEASQADRFLNYVRESGMLPYDKAYQSIHSSFPNFRDFEGILNGFIRSGMITMSQQGNTIMLKYTGPI